MVEDVCIEAPNWRPTTTMLYGLMPRGWGTGDVESVLSYEMSLAFEHRLALTKLRRLVRDRARVNDKLVSGTELVNLVAATGRPELHACSLRTLQSLIGDMQGARGKRVCLDCCRADLRQPGVLSYGRLLWEIREVTCCPIHKKQLLKPQCGRSNGNRKHAFGFLRRITLFGVCAKCGALGYRCNQQKQERASVEQLQVAEMLRGLVANLTEIASADTQGVKNAVGQLLQENGGLVAVAQKANICKSTLSRWLSQPSARMRLKSFVAIAHAMSVNLSDLLQGRVTHVSYKALRIERASHKVVDQELARRVLADAIRRGQSLHVVGQRTGYDRRTLRAIAPDVCKQLVERGRQRRSMVKQQRYTAVAEEVRSAVKELQAKGVPLTNRNTSLLPGGRWGPVQLKSRFLSLFRRALGEECVPAIPDMPIDADMVRAVDEAVATYRAEIATHSHSSAE